MSMRANQEAMAEYEKQLKLGRKEKGELLALDDYLKEKKIVTVGEMSLGVVQIPIDQIVGTKHVKTDRIRSDQCNCKNNRRT